MLSAILPFQRRPIRECQERRLLTVRLGQTMQVSGLVLQHSGQKINLIVNHRETTQFPVTCAKVLMLE